MKSRFFTFYTAKQAVPRRRTSLKLIAGVVFGVEAAPPITFGKFLKGKGTLRIV